jgi:hypothetical protein
MKNSHDVAVLSWDRPRGRAGLRANLLLRLNGLKKDSFAYLVWKTRLPNLEPKFDQALQRDDSAAQRHRDSLSAVGNI